MDKTINDWLETYNIDSQSQSNDIELTIPDNLIIDETSFTKDSYFIYNLTVHVVKIHQTN